MTEQNERYEKIVLQYRLGSNIGDHKEQLQGYGTPESEEKFERLSKKIDTSVLVWYDNLRKKEKERLGKLVRDSRTHEDIADEVLDNLLAKDNSDALSDYASSVPSKNQDKVYEDFADFTGFVHSYLREQILNERYERLNQRLLGSGFDLDAQIAAGVSNIDPQEYGREKLASELKYRAVLIESLVDNLDVEGLMTYHEKLPESVEAEMGFRKLAQRIGAVEAWHVDREDLVDITAGELSESMGPVYESLKSLKVQHLAKSDHESFSSSLGEIYSEDDLEAVDPAEEDPIEEAAAAGYAAIPPTRKLKRKKKKKKKKSSGEIKAPDLERTIDEINPEGLRVVVLFDSNLVYDKNRQTNCGEAMQNLSNSGIPYFIITGVYDETKLVTEHRRTPVEVEADDILDSTIRIRDAKIENFRGLGDLLTKKVVYELANGASKSTGNIKPEQIPVLIEASMERLNARLVDYLVVLNEQETENAQNVFAKKFRQIAGSDLSIDDAIEKYAGTSGLETDLSLISTAYRLPFDSVIIVSNDIDVRELVSYANRIRKVGYFNETFELEEPVPKVSVIKPKNFATSLTKAS